MLTKSPMRVAKFKPRNLTTNAITGDRITITINFYVFFFQAEDGIRDLTVTGVQTCALPIYAYCVANNLEITPEADTGSGVVDFKFAASYVTRVLVETKLSNNKKLVHGYGKIGRASCRERV